MRVLPDRLKEITVQIVKGLGASHEEAGLVAESLVRADMRGTDTHGVTFLKLLADRVDVRMVNLPTRLNVIKDDVGHRPDRWWQRTGPGRCPPGDDDEHGEGRALRHRLLPGAEHQ